MMERVVVTWFSSMAWLNSWIVTVNRFMSWVFVDTGSRELREELLVSSGRSFLG